MFSFKKLLAISCWILLTITSIKMQVINYQEPNSDQQQQYEPNTPYVSYQYVRTPYTDQNNKHQFVLQHEQTNSNGDNRGGRQRVVVQPIYQNEPNFHVNREIQQTVERKFINQQQQQPQRQQSEKYQQYYEPQQEQQSQKYQQYYQPQQQQQYYQSKTPIQQQQILQPQNYKQQQQQQHYYQQQPEPQLQQQPTDQYLQSPSNVEHYYQQLINNNNNRPATNQKYQKQKYQQQQYQQQPVTTNNKQTVSSFLPSYLTDDSDTNMVTNTTQPCLRCCIEFEYPCSKCCSTPFLSSSVLKSTVG